MNLPGLSGSGPLPVTLVDGLAAYLTGKNLVPIPLFRLPVVFINGLAPGEQAVVSWHFGRWLRSGWGFNSWLGCGVRPPLQGFTMGIPLLFVVAARGWISGMKRRGLVLEDLGLMCLNRVGSFLDCALQLHFGFGL